MTSLPYTRVRSRSSDYDEQTVVVAGTSTGTYGPYITSQKLEDMTDVVTPGYHRKVTSGAIVNNDCLYEVEELDTIGDGFGHYQKAPYDYTISGPLTWFRANQTWPSYADLNLNANADAETAKFWALANIDPTPYAFGEDLFEIGETIRFLRNPLGSLRNLSRSFRSDFFDAVKRRRHRSIQRILKHRTEALADVWLQYRFAFSPLVRSLHDGYEALLLDKVIPPERRTARGFSIGEDSGDKTWTTLNSGTTYTWYKSKRLRKDYKATILYEMSNPVYDWRHSLGLRNKDLPETFWQVLPYSFMIDRLVNVSAAIRGLVNLASPQLKILAASTRLKQEEFITFQMLDEARSGWTISAQGETRTRKDFMYSRSTYTPSAVDATPPVTPEGLFRSFTETLDLVALVYKNVNFLDYTSRRP